MNNEIQIKKIMNLIKENGYGEVNLLVNKKVSNCNSEKISLAFYIIKEDKKISGTICLSNDLSNYKIVRSKYFTQL